MIGKAILLVAIVFGLPLDDPGVPPYTVEPANPCCSPGPYDTWQDALNAQQYQQQQTNGYPYIIDHTGVTP